MDSHREPGLGVGLCLPVAMPKVSVHLCNLENGGWNARAEGTTWPMLAHNIT